MTSLTHKTTDWVKNGLISEAQAQGIITFEKNRKSLFSLFSMVLFLGFFSVAIGVVTVVSANWFSISNEVKMAGLFVCLIAAAVLLDRIKKQHPLLFEGGLFFYMLLLFAAIGLIGQVYHLKSDTYVAFLFWSALAFPLLFLTRKVLFGFFWEFVFFAALSASPWGQEALKVFFETFPSTLVLSFFAMVLFFVVSRFEKMPVFVRPVRVAAAFLTLFCLMFDKHYVSFFEHMHVRTPILFSIVVIGFCGFVALCKSYHRGEKQALLMLTGLYVLFFLFPPFRGSNYFFQLIILIGFVFTAYSFGAQKAVRFLVAVTAIRMLIAFFSLFGSLMYTGIGLIVSGMVILGIAYACFRLDAYMKLKVGKGNQHD